MADEITIRVSLRVVNGTLYHQSNPTAFTANMAGTGGPSPGTIVATTAGTDVYFTGLTEPGWCSFQNYDPTNYVQIGIYEPTGAVFYPMLELLPGEIVIVRLTRNLFEQYSGSGTGTSPQENKLRVKADVASCKVQVNGFDR